MKEKLYLKISAITAVFVIAIILSFSLIANANEDESDDVWKTADRWWKTGVASEHARSVTMKANGDFIVSGVVVNSVSSSTDTINVRFYGFDRDINVAGAKIIGGGQRITIADFNPGDVLFGRGNYNESTRVITVSEIKNLSYRTRHVTSIQARIQELLDLVRQLQEKLKKLTQ